MRPLLRATVLCALLLTHAAAARAEWVIDAGGDIVYEDNLTRATSRADRRSDIALSPALAIGHYSQLADATSLLVTADFKGSLYPRFERLSNISSTLTLGVRQKFGLGAFAPWLRVFAAGGAIDYGENLRDSVIVDTGVQVGKRLSERFDVQAGYTYERLDARSRVFDQESHTLALEGGIGITDALQLTLGYAVRWGDLVVHRTPAPGAAQTSHTRVVNTFDTPLEAVRIDATTHIVSAAVSYALTPRAAVTLGYEHQLSIGPLFTYPNNLVRGGFAYSF
ncbi:MAG TPA: hypothetical protein VGU22_13915 [Methylomirabilota bacterium]|jgi:hypothetical protein|nr:hypothetical protein [Methylomirabilota bacterium]